MNSHHHRSALLLLASVVASSTTTVVAFQPQSSSVRSSNSNNNNVINDKLNAVAVSDAEETIGSKIGNFLNNNNNRKQSGGGNGMPDLDGIAFSGLKGKALSLRNEDFPKAKDVKEKIPADCFEPDTATSLGYLSVSVIGTALCTAVGVNMLDVLDPANPLTWPVWTAYSAVTGTVAMGLWVLAHECGHGAFSKNRDLQDAVGYVLHSIMWVPYYSWQRSHAVHHQYTNNIELGETHVPEVDTASLELRDKFMDTLGEDNGLKAWGALQSFMHLIVGWPAYLMIGATGGKARGMTNHYYPNPLTEPDQPKKELFPGNWKEKVYKSDVGVALVVGSTLTWAACNGLPEVMALYGGPLLVVNMWLVAYTWLQHTDVDVPHFSQKDHTYMKGAFHTIDRPYDKLDPWGIIDFLHHKIGTTHVAHHYDSSIPHYKAQVATDAIIENFPEIYLYDPTPIPEAIWRIAKGCTAVEQRPGANGDDEPIWVWKNNGLEDKVSEL